MHGRRPPSSVAIATGIGAGVAVLWLLGTSGGRRRLRRALGRSTPGEVSPAPPTHIELPDQNGGHAVSSAIREGIAAAESITGSPEWIAVPGTAHASAPVAPA